MQKVDVVVIGAGMAGITAAIYLKRGNANFVILEGGKVGGKLNQLKEIENYPGLSRLGGSELIEDLQKHMDLLDIKVTQGKVQTILKNPDGFEVVSDVDQYQTKAVIVATGLVNKGENIPGEKEFQGKGVSYCATCDGNFFKGMDVAVYGNNDVALEETLYLSGVVSRVKLIVNSDELKGEKETVDAIKKTENIDVYLNSTIKEIKGNDWYVTSIVIDTNGEEQEIEVAGVFPYVGNKSSSQFLSQLHPENQAGYLMVNEKMESSVTGLFVAGDVVNKRLRQLVTAANDGAIAAQNALDFLKKNK